MSNNSRKIIEAIYHGEDEGIDTYTLTIPTSWVTGPTAPVLVIYDNEGLDVTATCTDGQDATVAGQVISLPMITGVGYRERHEMSEGGITAGPKYRLEVRFTAGTSELEAWGDLYGEK